MSVQGGYPAALELMTRSWWRVPRHGLLATVTAVMLWVLYLLYGLLINPLVEADIAQQSLDQSDYLPPPPSQGVSMASQHLADQHWAADAKYQFRTNDAFVYAEEWEPIDSDRAIRFTPFAMIWLQRGRTESEPPITVSSRSARVQFASAFDFANPRPGRVTGGALQGEVRIQGPNGLLIEGRNFDFSETAMRLWSDHPVKFAYDGHRGTARGLQVDLIASEHPPADGTLAVSGIRKIQLLRDVSLELLLKQDLDGPVMNRPAVAQVRCAGRFEFDVASNIATFSDDVRVYRPTDARHTDSLQCDLLTLKFEPQSESDAARPSGGDPQLESSERGFRGIQSDLAFRRMRAQGRSVVLVSETNKLTAHMSDLIYDQQTRVAAMMHGESVRVLYESSELRCPEITLLHDADGRVESAWCRGAGWLKHHDPQTGVLELVARWARQLRKYREPDSDWEVIEFDRQAVVRHPGRQMGLSADFIKVWLHNTAEQDKPGATESAADRLSGGESGGYEPQRLLALRDVAVASPRLQGETQRLEVWFERSTPSGDPAADRPQSAAQPDRRPLSLVERPADRSQTAGRSQDPQQPLQVESDRIHVKMVKPAGAPQYDLRQIVSEGRVEIRQTHEPGIEPLLLTGDRLQLESRAENDQVLHVSGSPAHIRDRGTHIEGRRVHLDRHRNLAWVSGAGLLQLPVTRNLNGDKLTRNATLDIWWSEQMTFDGETGRFFGNVSGVLGDSRMRCQEMHVLLNRKIDFSRSDSAADSGDRGQKTDVYSILCKDGVDFRSYEYLKRQLTEVRRARCAHLAINQGTGLTDASGPGWITFWRRGRGGRAALEPTATVRANAPLESDKSEWEYTRIEFVGQASGNLSRRATTFRDQVRVVYGPVSRPLQVIDPEKLPPQGLPKDGGIMRCDTLQFNQHASTAERDGYIELLATGNAFLEGRSFHARADTISFDESKERYILRSIEPHKATIWRQESIGEEYSGVEAQRMEFSPKRNQLKFDRATGLQGIR